MCVCVCVCACVCVCVCLCVNSHVALKLHPPPPYAPHLYAALGTPAESLKCGIPNSRVLKTCRVDGPNLQMWCLWEGVSNL